MPILAECQTSFKIIAFRSTIFLAADITSYVGNMLGHPNNDAKRGSCYGHAYRNLLRKLGGL